MSAILSPRTKLSREIKLLLGDQMVDVELDQDHIDLAIDMAIERMRQRSDGATSEETMFLTLVPDQTEYTLPTNVQNVVKIHRRGVGVTIGGGGINFDPISASYANYYLLQAGQTGGIATWELFSEYKETLNRVFASEVNFIWNYDIRRLSILRRPMGEETVMLTVMMQKTGDLLITNYLTGPWVRSYALAQCKFMLGEARSKFKGGLPGPHGNIQMNGEDLKQEGLAALEVLEKELMTFVASDNGMPFIIG